MQNKQKNEYPIPEIPDDSEKKSGMDRVLLKIIGFGRVSGTRQSLLLTRPELKISAISFFAWKGIGRALDTN